MGQRRGAGRVASPGRAVSSLHAAGARSRKAGVQRPLTFPRRPLPQPPAAQNLQGRRQAERAALSPLLAAAQPQMMSLEPGATVRLVPIAFMHLWRAYMHQAGKRSSAKASEVRACVWEGCNGQRRGRLGCSAARAACSATRACLRPPEPT